jgi:quinol monooxygenase YgiN
MSVLAMSILLTVSVVAACTSDRRPDARSAVSVLVTVEALPGRGEEVATRFRRPQERCTPDVGCLGFEIFRSRADPDRVVVLERWASADAHRAFFDAATAMPSFEEFLTLLKDGLHLEYLTQP